MSRGATQKELLKAIKVLEGLSKKYHHPETPVEEDEEDISADSLDEETTLGEYEDDGEVEYEEKPKENEMKYEPMGNDEWSGPFNEKEKYHICEICHTDPVNQMHHIIPRSRGGEHSTIHCCRDCGNQIHMLFTNKELENMQQEGLLTSYEMKTYLNWKKKHPGDHSYKASKKIREWKKGHRS